MDFDFDIDSGFGNLSASVENIEIKKAGKMERVWKIGDGGSILFTEKKNGKIFFGAADGYIYCVDLSTGETLWTFKANAQCLAKPEVMNGKVYSGSFDNRFYCLDENTGKMLWAFETGDKIFCSACFWGNYVYVGSRDNFFYCLDSETGKEIWRFKAGDSIGAMPTSHKDSVLVSSFDGNMYRLDAATGKEIWRFKTGAEIHTGRPPLVHENIIYFPSHDNYLYAVNFENGKEVWRYKSGKYASHSIPRIWNGMMYWSDREGYVIALTMGGKELWKKKVGGFVTKIMVYESGLYFGSEDSNLYHFDFNGNEIWRFPISGGSYDEPEIIDGKIYFGSMDCHVYCLDLNGNELWRFTTSTESICPIIPVDKEYEAVVKKSAETIENEIAEEKYSSKTETLNLSDYGEKSEYVTKSEYVHKSEYTTDFVIFEGVTNFGISVIPAFFIKYQLTLI